MEINNSPRETFKASLQHSVTSIEEDFNKKYSEFLIFLKEMFKEFLVVDNDKTQLQKNSKEVNRLIDSLNDKDFFMLEDYILELSQPKYRTFIGKIQPPKLPVETKDNNSLEFNLQMKESKLNIELFYYIKDIIYAYSIYHNHQIRNYFSALGAHIATIYAKRFSHTIKIHFRYKAPRALMIKLAKNIFISGQFHIDPSGKNTQFKYESLHDIFGMKVEPSYNSTLLASNDEEISKIIDQKDKLYESLKPFHAFQYNLTYEPDLITCEEYLNKCLDILQFRLDFTVPLGKNNGKILLRDHLESQQILINTELNKLRKLGKLHSPIPDSYIDNNLFNKWLETCKGEIDSPLTFSLLKKNLNALLYRENFDTKNIGSIRYMQDAITNRFGISVVGYEHKNTKSGHEAHHYDIQTLYIDMEIQGETPEQADNDRTGPIAAHALMPNKQLELVDIPPENTYGDICVFDSKGIPHFFNQDEIEKYKRKIEQITPKKGIIEYDPNKKLATVTFFSSIKNYHESVSELPRYTSDPDIENLKSLINDYFSELNIKSKAILEILFHYPGSYSTTWTFDQIKDFANTLEPKTIETEKF